MNLNYENFKALHFTNLRDMILKDTTPLHLHNPKNIKRKDGCVVVSEHETKEYKVVFKKRWLLDKFDFLLYGHV